MGEGSWPLGDLGNCDPFTYESRLNDCSSWGWLEKTGGPKIFNACVEPAEVDVPPADTGRKRKGRLVFWGSPLQDVRR